MKKIYKVITVIIFALILLIPATAFGQMAVGNVENAISQDEFRGCEFMSIQEVYLPMRIAITFPSTPDVSPVPKATDPQSQFSSDFNNQGFFFATNATDVWNIELRLGYEKQGAEPRDIMYEIITDDGAVSSVGNWHFDDDSFCKILELQTRQPPHIKTDAEIIKVLAEWELEQHEITHKKQSQTNDMIAVIAIGVTGVGAIFLVILFLMRIQKSKDNANADYVSKQFASTVTNLHNTIKLLKTSEEHRDMKIDYIVDAIKDGLRTIGISIFNHDKKVKEMTFKPIKPLMPTEQEKVETATSFFEKLKVNVLHQAGIKDKPEENLAGMFESDLANKLNEKTTDELYELIEEMDKEKHLYNLNEDYRTKYDIVVKILKIRGNV